MIQSGEKEWNEITQATPREILKYGKITTEEFRIFGNAAAWLEWTSYCTIKKIETFKPQSGAATNLLDKLKELANKHSFSIFANIAPYKTSIATNPLDLLDQNTLENWYTNRGFKLNKYHGSVCAWYPQPAA